MKHYYIYILANQKNGTLYIGLTSDIIKRIWQHQNDLIDGFTKKYSIHRLVYFEEVGDVRSAISREKQLKGWKRCWKIELIEQNNPNWDNLSSDIQ